MNGFQPYFMTLDQKDQRSALEAIIFASDELISTEDIFSVLFSKEDYEAIVLTGEGTEKEVSFKHFEKEIFEAFHYNTETIEKLINEINAEIISSGRPYQIVNYAGGWQFATKPEYGNLVAAIYKPKQKKKLSPAAIEAIAIIAYRQPISKSGVEEIRGVNSNEVVNTLLEKNLVKIVGRSDNLGKALLYGTTEEFLKMFGLKSLNDLPKLRELEEIARDHGKEEQDIVIKVDFEKEAENANE